MDPDLFLLDEEDPRWHAFIDNLRLHTVGTSSLLLSQVTYSYFREQQTATDIDGRSRNAIRQCR